MNKSIFLLLFVTATRALCAEETPMQNGIKHVVVLMLENRSFDNVLAWVHDNDNPARIFIPETTDPIYRGLNEDTLSQYTNSVVDSKGNLVFSSPPIKGVPSVADWAYLNSPQVDPNESFPHVVEQMYGDLSDNEPTMTGFLQNYASCWPENSWRPEQKNISAIMETYTDKELPIIYGLARHYAVSDDWYSSVPTCTNPNRAYAACGTSSGQILNGTLKSTFDSKTIWNTLTELSPETSWNIYWQSNLLPGIYSGPFTGPKTFHAMKDIPDVHSHIHNIAAFHEDARNGQLPSFSFIEPQLSEIMLEIDNFLLDELAGYRFMVGVQGNDMHPPGDVRTAENLVANIYTSLIANPKSWNETLLIITFDEHGGLFDHMPPPRAIAPDSHFENGFMFDRYGVRVPALFISPLIQKSTVVRSDIANTPFDHTSLVATVLQWKKIDKDLWNMGKRAYNAPTFNTVITRKTPRGDAVIAPAGVKTRAKLASDELYMGDKFYLKNKEGKYLVKNSFFFNSGAFAATDDKTPVSFISGQGPVTHGSFAFIALDGTDKVLEAPNMEGGLLSTGCSFEERTFSSGQWWTVKSVDRPYLGAGIQNGDRIYLESHVFLDIFQFMPARLVAKEGGFFKSLLTCVEIGDSSSDDNYWIIEKAL